MLGFDFDDNPGDHTIWLTEDFRADILEKLKKWIREGEHGKRGTPFEEFRNYLEKLRNVFISIPYGKGLLSPCSQVLGKELKNIFLHRKKTLLLAICNCRHLLNLSKKIPTPCKELVTGWPHYIRVKDTSSHIIGGIITGKGK